MYNKNINHNILFNLFDLKYTSVLHNMKGLKFDFISEIVKNKLNLEEFSNNSNASFG